MNLYSIESIHLKTSKGKKEKKLTNVPAQLQQPKKISLDEKWRRCTVIGQFGFIGLKKQRSYEERGRQKEYKR